MTRKVRQGTEGRWSGEVDAGSYRRRVLGRLLAEKAAELGDKPFLLFEDRRYSYRQVDQLSNQVANGLRALGVGFGSHVALLIDNRPELLLSYFALARLGAVAVPLNTAAKGEMLAYFLRQSDSTHLIAEHGYLRRVAEVLPGVPAIRQIVALDEGAAGPKRAPALDCPIEPFESLLRAPSTEIDVAVKASDLCLLMYSSGTTGRSKASMASHCCALSHGYSIAEAFGYDASDVIYVTLPLFHGNAWYCSTLPALVAGGTVALARRFSVSQFWEEVKRFGVTQFNLLGAMSNFLLSRPHDPLERSHSVRQAMVIPRPADERAFEERFKVKVTSLYGLTDAGIVSTTELGDASDREGSAGRPCPDVEVRVVDDADFDVPRGTPGEIVLRGRGPWIFPTGYYRMPEATVAAWRNLWFHTGDRGFFDAEGRLHFADRKKDAIRRRGENISCFEVEQILSKMPGVLLTAAYPVTAEYAEDEVMVSVVPQEGARLTPEQVVHFCQENMAYFMVPRFVDLVGELPMTMNGKVEKYKLRERAQAGLDRIWDREKAGIRVAR